MRSLTESNIDDKIKMDVFQAIYERRGIRVYDYEA